MAQARAKRARPAQGQQLASTCASLVLLSASSNNLEPAGGGVEHEEKLRMEPSIVVRLEEEHACELHNGRTWMRQQEAQVMG